MRYSSDSDVASTLLYITDPCHFADNCFVVVKMEILQVEGRRRGYKYYHPLRLKLIISEILDRCRWTYGDDILRQPAFVVHQTCPESTSLTRI